MGRCSCTAAPGVRTPPASPMPMRTSVPCASPTARTRCTATRSPSRRSPNRPRSARRSPPRNIERGGKMIKLCGFHVSNYHNKVRIALLEKGIAFEEDSTVTPSQKDEYLALSPMGKVPYLEVAGTRLCECGVVLEYLEEAYPQQPLLPEDPLALAPGRR